MDKLKFKRWNQALNIAKVLFWADGYHTKYLKEIEKFIQDIQEREGQYVNISKNPKEARYKP